MRKRACAVVLSGNRLIFVNQNVNGKACRVFIGGGIEENETADGRRRGDHQTDVRQ